MTSVAPCLGFVVISPPPANDVFERLVALSGRSSVARDLWIGGWQRSNERCRLRAV